MNVMYKFIYINFWAEERFCLVAAAESGRGSVGGEVDIGFLLLDPSSRNEGKNEGKKSQFYCRSFGCSLFKFVIFN